MEIRVFAVYIAVTLLASAANGYASYLSFIRHESVKATADKTRVPQSWMIPLGVLLAAGALGLLVGFAVPLLGTLAAVGLVLYFLGALGAHLRARNYQLGAPAFFLSLAAAALAVNLAYRTPW
jgi:hypothetical protein